MIALAGVCVVAALITALFVSSREFADRQTLGRCAAAGTALAYGTAHPRPPDCPSADPVQVRFADDDNSKSEENMATRSPSNILTVPPPHAARAWRAPIPLPLSAGAWWLVATVLFSLLLYFFVGIDQGAVSAFGRDMHIHEFMHDGRHFASFPCH